MKRESGKSSKQRCRVATLVPRATKSSAAAERAKLAFARKASSLGFGLYETVGENQPYDFIIDNGVGLWRMQVKSIDCINDLDRRTRCRGGDGKHDTANEIDFVAAYVVPEDAWYIIPVSFNALASAGLSGGK